MEHTILIAEDDVDIAGLLRIYLENSGYGVLIAENGVEALELLQQHRVSLAILDVMMPKMDGFTLTEEIRKISNLPLIILSAKGKEEDRVHGLEIGADECDASLLAAFARMEPTGNGNERPLLKIETESVRLAPCKNPVHSSVQIGRLQTYAFNFYNYQKHERTAYRHALHQS